MKEHVFGYARCSSPRAHALVRHNSYGSSSEPFLLRRRKPRCSIVDEMLSGDRINIVDFRQLHGPIDSHLPLVYPYATLHPVRVHPLVASVQEVDP